MADQIPDSAKLLPCPNPWCENIRGVEPARHILTKKWHICCGDCLIDGPWADTYDLAIAAWNTRAAPPAMDREAVVQLKGDSQDPYSFSGDEDEDGFVISQHRFYKWGDDCIIAVGELNAPNTWDDEAFDAKCQTLLSTLSADAIRQGEGSFQERVQPWLMACFGEMIAGDREERNHRFLEEALELVQACGCTASEAHQLVDYVYGRPVGEPHQEVGGVMVTLAALCLANKLDMHANGETELTRIWTKVEAIRAKQAAKPKHSPLPEHVPATPASHASDGGKA